MYQKGVKAWSDFARVNRRSVHTAPDTFCTRIRYFVPIIVVRFAASSESPVQFVKLDEPTGAVVQMVPSL